jgi:hypothetical protein
VVVVKGDVELVEVGGSAADPSMAASSLHRRHTGNRLRITNRREAVAAQADVLATQPSIT